MRAWHVERYGEPVDVLRLAEVPDPAPGPGQVLVGVRAVAVNFPDVLLARGQYQERPPLPFVPGIELCGDVLAVGDGVEHVAVGDRVVGSRIGVLAERAVLDAHEVWRAPVGLSDEQAAGFVIAYQTAWFALHRRAGLRRGETVL
ncbi:alcohol dehydrogenase catalytic domain-containing protein, partial [Cellulomonas septica]|nr:alcohol dehydrogenase catalytic domain-containing protein [Cellulomonas septica]